MAGNYISTNMETGVQVKEALERIEAYQPDLFTWNEISDAVTVNLKSPTVYSGIKDPGDYVVYKFSNGPSEIPSTLAPVLMSIRNGKICITVNGKSYLYDSSNDTWNDLDSVVDNDTTMWVKSDTEPTRTNNTFWFDTSHENDTNDPHVDLKYYNTTTNTWESVFNEENYLKVSEIDPDHKEMDIFKYVTDRITEVIGEYGDFLKHVNNELTLIHVTGDDRARYANLMTEDELRALINDTYKPAFEQLINETINDELPVSTVETDLENLNEAFDTHTADHITATDISNWTNKADGNHTHDYTTGNQKIDASQITSGTIPASKLPEEVKERYYEITAESAEAEFSNTSITENDRKSKYHNGNGFYLTYVDEETNETKHKWYRIIDQTKIGTINWADGIIEFTAKDSKLIWENITGRPTTLEEFGITSDVYTKTQVNEKFSVYEDAATDLENRIDALEGTSDYIFSRNDINIENPSISTTVNEPGFKMAEQIFAIYRGPDKFVALTPSKTNTIDALYSTDGITWYYGSYTSNLKINFYKGGSQNYSKNISENENSQFISDNPIPSDMPTKIVYGNNTYVAICMEGSVILYSHDGINWEGAYLYDSDENKLNTKGQLIFDGTKFVVPVSNDCIMTTTDFNTFEYIYPDNQGESSVKTYSFPEIDEDTYAFSHLQNLCYADNKYRTCTMLLPIDYYQTGSVTDLTFNFYSSTDLCTWTLESQYIHEGEVKDRWVSYSYSVDGGLFNLRHLEYLNNKYILYPHLEYAFTNNILVSDDYTTWQHVYTVDKEVDIGIMSLDFCENYYFITVNNDADPGELKNISLLYSKDAITWTPITVDPNEYNYAHSFYGAAGANHTYVFGDLVGNLWYSNDPVIESIGIQEVAATPTEFTDVGTGTVPQTDIIVKTSDGKIYKTTKNINSTYRFNNTVKTTQDAAEPIGAGFTEKNIKEYEYVYEDPNTIYDQIVFNDRGDGIWYAASYHHPLLQSTDGSTWTMVNDEFTFEGIDLEHSGGRLSSLDKYSTYYALHVNGESKSTFKLQGWDSVSGLAINPTGNSAIYSVNYDNNWVGICDDGTGHAFITVSDDNTVWNPFYEGEDPMDIGLKTKYYGGTLIYINKYKYILVQNYCDDENDIHTFKISEIDQGMETITDLFTSDELYTDNYVYDKLYYFKGRYYFFREGRVLYFTTDNTTPRDIIFKVDGKNIEPGSFSNIPMWIDKDNNIAYIIYLNYETKRYTLASSTDGINFTSIYTLLESNVIPLAFSCAKDQFVVVGKNGIYTFDKYRCVQYNWNLVGNTTPLNSDKVLPKFEIYNVTEDGTEIRHDIDETYNYGDRDSHTGGSYVFSGWDKINSIWVDNESPIVSNVNGTWSWTTMLEYKYNWNADEVGVPGVALPDSGSAEYNTNATVDTTYANGSIVDGINWTESTMPNVRNWRSVCYGNGKFVAVAYNSNYFAYSNDGMTWTESTMSDDLYWQSVCYGNGKFVAVSTNTNRCAYSTDGITWTRRTIGNTSRRWYSVCYGNGKFVAVVDDSNYFAYSNDGMTWTESTMPNARWWWSVCYGNGKFVAVAYNSNYFAYSNDGMTWTESKVSSANRYWTSVCYGNGKFVAVAYNSNYFAYSNDGMTWTESTMSDDLYWRSVCYGNDKFVAVASSTNYFAYSNDGINWTEWTMPDYRSWYSVCYGDGKFVAVVDDSNYFAYSNNDLTKYYQFSGWDQSDFVITEDTTISGTWERKNKLAVTYSWSGAPSSLTSVPPDTSYYLPNANVTVDTYYDKNTRFIINDSNEWVEGTMPNSRNWCSVCYGNETFVAVSNSKCVAYSTDGINWTEIELNTTYNRVIYGNDRFIVYYHDVTGSNSSCMYSTNGIIWIQTSLPQSDMSNTVCYGNGKFVFAGFNDMSQVIDIYYSTDGITWTMSTGYTTPSYGGMGDYVIGHSKNTFILILNNANYNYLYADSTGSTVSNWTTSTLPDTTWNSICYGAGMTVISGKWRIIYSTDNINWTDASLSDIESYNWYSACYGDGKFIVVGSNGTQCAYSKNGTGWAVPTISATSRSWQSVCYGNGKFVAVASNTNYFVYNEPNTCYRFSGWNKSDFTITEDTNITGSWINIGSIEDPTVLVSLNSINCTINAHDDGYRVDINITKE